MPKSKRLVFFGNERLATGVKTDTPVLEALIKAGYEIVAIVSNNADSSRSRQQRKLEIASIAAENHIPLLLPEKLDSISDQLKSYGASAAVLVAYGKIIPASIIDIFPHGIINIHPSLLPQYRGPTPIEQAILDGSTKTGVSLMALSASMDAGPIFAQRACQLAGHETKQELADKLLGLGCELLLKTLPAVLDGSLHSHPQGIEQISYTKLILKSDGITDWGRSAIQIERQVRAYAGWPKVQARVSGHEIIITKARVAKDAQDGDLVVECSPGWLEVLGLTGPSGRQMAGADFIRGYGS